MNRNHRNYILIGVRKSVGMRNAKIRREARNSRFGSDLGSGATVASLYVYMFTDFSGLEVR